MSDKIFVGEVSYPDGSGGKLDIKLFINRDRLKKFGGDFARKARKNRDLICREASGILEFHIAGRRS